MNSIGFHKLPRVRLVSNRDELILSYCKGRNVLHLGCAGSVDKVKKGTALHPKIVRVAAKTAGVDTNEQALEYLRHEGISELFCADVEVPGQLGVTQVNGTTDVIVAGEILEHLFNPGLCLQNIANLMRKEDSILLLTVPNAFSLRNFFSVLSRKKELVRGDHHYYFSYVTIKSLLAEYGFSIADIYTYSNLRTKQNPMKRIAKKVLNNTVLRYSPFLAEGLIVIAVRQNSS